MLGAVEGPTETVNVDVAVPSVGGVTGLTLNVVVTPVGAPETERVTGKLKPFNDVIVIVDVSEPPCAMVREVGDAEIEKSGGGTTTLLK